MEFDDILDEAMYGGVKLIVTTKSRGEIEGVPTYLDDFISDPERLGYCLDVGRHESDTVFLDEIVEIRDSKTEAILSTAV